MGINLDAMQNTFQTTDATTTSVVSYSFPSNASGIVQVRVIGTDSSQNTIGIETRAIVKRGMGICSLVGLGESTIKKESDVALSLAGEFLSVNGSSIDVNVTGVALTTINWAARIDILYLN